MKVVYCQYEWRLYIANMKVSLICYRRFTIDDSFFDCRKYDFYWSHIICCYSACHLNPTFLYGGFFKLKSRNFLLPVSSNCFKSSGQNNHVILTVLQRNQLRKKFRINFLIFYFTLVDNYFKKEEKWKRTRQYRRENRNKTVKIRWYEPEN